MTSPVRTGLARVTVAAPARRLDVALPEDLPVAAILPDLLRHAGEDAADAGELHGGWVLRRGTGALVAPTQTLAAQGVRDGEILHLVARRDDWPEPEYDDVVEAIATGARRHGGPWTAAATRRTALITGAAAIVLAGPALLRAGPPWAVPGAVALGLAALLAAAGVTISRAVGDAVAGAAVAAVALPFALVGGLLVAAPRGTELADLGAPQVLLASVVLLLFAVIGQLGAAALAWVFAAAGTAATFGVLGGLAGLTSLRAEGVVAMVVTAALVFLPGYPMVAIRLGRLPLPALPQRAEDILADLPVPDRADVFAATARAGDLLTGILTGVAVTSAICVAALAGSGDAAAVLLAGVAAAVLLLRARLFPTVRQRIPLLVAGIAAVAAALVVPGLHARTSPPLYLLVAAAVLIGVLVLLLGLLYARRAPSPYVGRFADVVDVAAIVALIPITCMIVGFYGYVQGLFGSVGG